MRFNKTNTKGKYDLIEYSLDKTKDITLSRDKFYFEFNSSAGHSPIKLKVLTNIKIFGIDDKEIVNITGRFSYVCNVDFFPTNLEIGNFVETCLSRTIQCLYKKLVEDIGSSPTIEAPYKDVDGLLKMTVFGSDLNLIPLNGIPC